MSFRNFLISYGMTVIIVVVAITMFSCLTYPEQKIVDTLKMSSVFLVPLYAAPVLFSFERDENAKRLLSVINVITYAVSHRKNLENVGINQASLFPEVDKVADYLRRMA